MDRRRATGTKTRPASVEEGRLWAQTFSSLQEVSRLQSSTTAAETWQRVNRWMGSLPHEEALQMDSLETFKSMRTRLTTGLGDLKSASEAEAKALEGALDTLKALIALRRGPTEDKRTKRIRVASPAVSAPGSPRTGPQTAPLPPQPSQLNLSAALAASQTHQPLSAQSATSSGSRSSQGPQSFRARIQMQLPLQPGRKVAFRQPPQVSRPGIGGGGGGRGLDADGEGETWILAVVKKCIGGDKTKYEVQDEDTEDGEPGQKYPTTIKHLLPLPDPEAPLESPSHPSAYDEYQVGQTVLGLYPDTSCFYTAIVEAGPSSGAVRGVQPKNGTQSYRLKFEDDDDQVRLVGVQWVVSPPP